MFCSYGDINNSVNMRCFTQKSPLSNQHVGVLSCLCAQVPQATGHRHGFLHKQPVKDKGDSVRDWTNFIHNYPLKSDISVLCLTPW